MSAVSSFLLLLDVGTQLEDVLLAGGLKLVGEAEVFDLNLWRKSNEVSVTPELSRRRCC